METTQSKRDRKIMMQVGGVTLILVSVFGYIFWKQLQQEKIDTAAVFGR